MTSRARGTTPTTAAVPLTSKFENFGASLNLSFGIGDSMTLKSITAYRELDWQGVRDADNTPLTILHTYYDVSGDQLSEELQLTYESERTVGVFGLYYFEQTSDDIATMELNPPPPGIQRDSDNNKVDNQSWAAFTQWTFKFTDMFAATVGGRYTEDKKDAYPDQFDYATPAIKQIPAQWYSDTFSSFTPSAHSAAQLERKRDDIPELFRRLQGRRLEQPLQRRTDAGAAGRVASIRAGRGEDPRARHQAGPGEATLAPEPGDLHV